MEPKVKETILLALRRERANLREMYAKALKMVPPVSDRCLDSMRDDMADIEAAISWTLVQ